MFKAKSLRPREHEEKESLLANNYEENTFSDAHSLIIQSC